MNSDELKGKWMQLKGGVKKQWAKLTDDDITYMEGNLQQAAGRLRERYGYTREQAEKEWNDFVGASTQGTAGRIGRSDDDEKEQGV